MALLRRVVSSRGLVLRLLLLLPLVLLLVVRLMMRLLLVLVLRRFRLSRAAEQVEDSFEDLGEDHVAAERAMH